MSIVLIWCAAFASDLLFAGQISWHEIVTGIVLASLATAWMRTIRRASQRPFRFSAELLRPLARALGKLVPATFATGAVLVRVAGLGHRAGDAEVHDFEYGAPDDSDGSIESTDLLAAEGRLRQAVDRARRALALLLVSYAPDRFVVNVEAHSGTVLIHVIVPSRREPDPRWLI